MYSSINRFTSDGETGPPEVDRKKRARKSYSFFSSFESSKTVCADVDTTSAVYSISKSPLFMLSVPFFTRSWVNKPEYSNIQNSCSPCSNNRIAILGAQYHRIVR